MQKLLFLKSINYNFFCLFIFGLNIKKTNIFNKYNLYCKLIKKLKKKKLKKMPPPNLKTLSFYRRLLKTMDEIF